MGGLDPLISTLKQKVTAVKAWVDTLPRSVGCLETDWFIEVQINKVDADILAAVRQQSTSGSRARHDLTKAKQTIEQLFSKINDIQRKAEQSELMVQEICRDIKKLDFAKKHLTSTITALRRLAMLVNAVGKVLFAAECTKYMQQIRL